MQTIAATWQQVVQMNQWAAPMPVFCAECDRPMGYVAQWLIQLWGTMLCSSACAVMAEWHAPERR